MDKLPLVQYDGQVAQLLSDTDGLAVPYVQFDTTYTDGHSVGKLHWNSEVGTLEFGLPGGEVKLQIGQEQLILVHNHSGNTIPNGSLVYYTGTEGGLSTIDFADATRENWPKALVRGITTEAIEHDSNGYLLIAGVIHDVDTDGMTPGVHLYLDTTGNGTFTNTRPTSPDYVMGIGTVTVPHATEGTIQIEFDRLWDLEWASNVQFSPAFETDQFLGWKPDNQRYELLRSQRNFFNGTTRESFNATINSTDGTTIQLYLEQAGGGDLTMQFTDGDSQLDCTPAQTINITPGLDETPTGTMVYIPFSTKTLVSDTEWPDEEHIKICYLAVPSANFVFDHGGPYVNQNWNDHLSDTQGVIGQGHLSHVAQKIRLGMGAGWTNGVNPDGVDGYFTHGASSVTWKSTAGVISQMHVQNFEAKDTSANNIILVANDFDAAYAHVANLFDITDDATGNSIGNNRYFSLIFWGVQNKTDQGSGLMVNLPAGNYTSELSATLDTGGYDDYNFPREFTLDSGTAFLICRSTFKMGTTGWTHIQTEDLRGKVPSNQVGGGSGGGITDHGALGGLADDDHLQYSLVDGTRAFTGNVTVTGGVITANNIDSPSGADMVLNSTAPGVATFNSTLNITYLVTANIISPTSSVNFADATIFTTGNFNTTGTLNATTANIGNLSVLTNLFTSNTGTVNFNDDHIVTTGNVTGQTFTGNIVQPIGGSIGSANGVAQFGATHIVTTGNTSANTYEANNYIRTDILRTWTGTLSMPAGGNFSAAGYVRAGTSLIAVGTLYADQMRGNLGTVISLGDHELTTTGCLTANTVTATVVLELPTYNDSTRPTASTLTAGSAIYNTDDSAPNFSDGTQWRSATGLPT